MIMTAWEIVTSYKQAANQKHQINVLAQLNGCGVSKIEQILADAGVDTSDTYTGRTWNAGEERRLRQLAAEGKTAGEIGALMHRSHRSVTSKAKCIGLKLALEAEKNHV